MVRCGSHGYDVYHHRKKGFVVRTRSDEDRRVVQVELSKEGKKREQIFFERRLNMGHEMLALLSARERNTFLELMAKVTAQAIPAKVPQGNSHGAVDSEGG